VAEARVAKMTLYKHFPLLGGHGLVVNV
jgi:hypothetical protein